MDIPIITGGDISIKDIQINTIPTYDFNNTSTSIPLAAPVVVNIGVPVVNIPGCVEATETNSAKNNQLREDDPNGVVTFCDSGVPNFNPLSFEPNQMIMTGPPKVDTRSPDTPTPPEVKPPQTKQPVVSAVVECPTPVQEAQEPVGTLVEGFRKKVTGYELIDTTCVQITEPVALPTQILAGLPSGGQVMQVGGIAVIATSSALLAKPLADILLKAVKPAVKKFMKKIAKIRGKKPPILSSGERRAEQRQMNHAVKALRSVFPRRKKKR
ncbi:hypothetical protein W2100709_177 [Cyanophage S-RIM44]|uniref:Uncharacterized protein n=2 Tax=Vellamovirus TaxID=2733139 RepID=A0A1D7SHI3_9CAUD|nr:hypothetical protein Syn1_178 [Prochlorococcus phage Syn1]ADO99279.1 hypothetical protein Syn1_178 [Prochlorococcus phage Syn1]AOO12593.1 hypothetical protein Sn080709_176 [Cyanophage S-RIM44]AOO13059.1 hypothetical protein W2100709_177 [Cyanophage S-RIM44]